MMTIITRVILKEGSEPEWDAVMRERLDAAREQPGWIGGQIVMPVGALAERVIIGTWRTSADWEAWHAGEAFAETRARLAGLERAPGEQSWHETIVDMRGTVEASRWRDTLTRLRV
jgi:heme-degrading monooxygenase HmoA